ncbi:MAG: hypothetical protein HRU19_10285 [Pseudobacteriovorax sp.]|nr:hypothetical protein [Pseudobacteriovorax sp.]
MRVKLPQEDSKYYLDRILLILCILGIIFNNHFLKTHYPTWISGKLSDFFGIIIGFQILVILGSWTSKWNYAHEVSSAILSSSYLIFIKLTQTGHDFHSLLVKRMAEILGYNLGGWQLIMDPSDVLLTLFFIPILIIKYKRFSRLSSP